MPRPPLRLSGFWDRLLAVLFGQDIFISYSRGDAVVYAEALANRLAALDYAVFLDQWGTQPGAEIPPVVHKALRRSAMLVCICSDAACQSQAVEIEIAQFKKTKRPIIPIDMERAIESARWFPLLAGLARTPETRSALALGTPSDQVVGRVQNAFQFTRRNQRVRAGFAFAFALLLLAVVAATYLAWQARQSAQQAVSEQRRAEKNAREAEKQRTAALQATQEAKKQADLAEKRTREAQEQQRIAERSTDIAGARQLAAQAEMLLADPIRLRESLQTAVRAARLLQPYAARSFEVDAALRHAIGMSPSQVRPPLPISGEPVRLLFPSAKRLVAVSRQPGEDETLVIENWSLEGPISPLPRREIAGTWQPIGADDRLLVVAAESGHEIWDLEVGKVIASVPSEQNLIAVGNGAQQIAIAGKEGVEIRDLRSGARARMIPYPEKPAGADSVVADHAAFSADETTIAIGYEFNTWSHHSPSRGAAVWPLRDDGPSVGLWKTERSPTMKFSPRGRLFWDDGGNLHVGNDEQAVRIPSPGPDGHFVISRDERLVATSTGQGLVRLWSAETGRELWRLLEPGAPVTLQFGPEDAWLATAGAAKTVRFWGGLAESPESGSVLAMPAGAEHGSTTLAISPDGKLFATIAHQQAHDRPNTPADHKKSPYVSVFQVFEAKTGRARTRPISLRSAVTRGAFSPDGRFLVTASEVYDPALSVWDTGSARKLAELTLPETLVSRLAFSPDGRTIAFALTSGSLSAWQWKDETRARVIGPGGGLAFDPVQNRLGFVRDRAVWFWDLARRAQPVEAFQLGETLSRLAFSPDGKFLAVETTDGQIWVRELASGQQVGLIEQLSGEGNLAFDRTGGYLTKEFNHQLRRAPWAMSTLVAEACARLREIAAPCPEAASPASTDRSKTPPYR
ncbi:MAG TPA: TIR domain-containing protein [Thermoanaerobaculia bacterium]|nr:TIR domain-containing protein [Thermoanaerobaculia bacterium]